MILAEGPVASFQTPGNVPPAGKTSIAFEILDAKPAKTKERTPKETKKESFLAEKKNEIKLDNKMGRVRPRWSGGSRGRGARPRAMVCTERSQPQPRSGGLDLRVGAQAVELIWGFVALSRSSLPEPGGDLVEGPALRLRHLEVGEDEEED